MVDYDFLLVEKKMYLKRNTFNCENEYKDVRWALHTFELIG